MAAQLFADFSNLPKAAFDSLGWATQIDQCPQKHCGAYNDIFRDKATGLEVSGPIDAARAARALQWVNALQMSLDNPRQPFRGWTPMPGFQFPGPENFGEALLAVFGELVTEATDPEFRARLADLCWSTQKKRSFALVEIAINSYLASVNTLCTDVSGEKARDKEYRWTLAVLRLKRACYLSLATKHILTNKVKDAFQDIFTNRATVAPLLELGQLLACYQTQYEGSNSGLINVCDQSAARAEAERQWDLLRHFLRLKANWERKAGLIDEAVASEERRAESYLQNAAEDSSSHGKARQVEKAITAYRLNSQKSPRIAVLRKLMYEYQSKGMEEMKTHSYSIGPRINLLAAAQYVSGLPFQDALRRLAMIDPPPNEAQIQTAVQIRSKDPWFAIAQHALLDWDGRVIARHGTAVSDDPEIREAAIRAEMFRVTVDHQKVIVGGSIEPARLQILSEHNASFHDFYQLLVDCPFVPPGRELFFARGLMEGLNGDFLLAAHLLIPQIEHAFRFHLKLRGADVTILKDEIQELMDINKMFIPATFGGLREKLLEIFGNDMVFELEGLLIRRYGSNLRNSFAHGLYWPDQFFDASVIYFWWVTLRLCLFHFPIPERSPQPTAQ